MPAAPAMPCGTSSLNEYALSPTPLTGVKSELAFIAASKAPVVMFFGPRATVSVPSGDVHTQPVIVNVTAGITISAGGFTLLPMTAWTSDDETRSAMATEVDDVETCDDDALEVQVPADVIVVALEVGAALAADDAAGEPVAVAELGAALDAALAVAAADALAFTAAELLARADGDAEVVFANADADGLTADDPNAAGEPLAPGVVPAGPHAIERKRAATAVVAMTLVLMSASRRR